MLSSIIFNIFETQVKIESSITNDTTNRNFQKIITKKDMWDILFELQRDLTF